MKQAKRKLVTFLFLFLGAFLCMNVTSNAKHIALSAKGVTISEGKSKTIRIKKVKAGSIESIQVKSSNDSIAAVKKKGKTKVIISANGVGTAKITATLKIRDDKNKTKTKTKKWTVIVKGKENVTEDNGFKVDYNSGGSVTAQIEGKTFSVTSGKLYSVNDGLLIKLIVQADAGYHIDSYKENGNVVSMNSKSDRAILYYSIREKCSISVEFTKNEETAAPTGRNRVIVIDGTVQGGTEFASGEKVTITVDPERGGGFNYWKINRGDVVLADSKAATTSFIMPNAEVILTAVYGQRDTSEVAKHFKSYFYEESGNVKCNKLEGFSAEEWAVESSDGIRPLEVFKDITGMDVPVSESYSYRFVSSDGQSTISIIGNITPGDNAEYATIKVSIPSCPEIQTIHIGSEKYFNGKNAEGVPVRFIE